MNFTELIDSEQVHLDLEARDPIQALEVAADTFGPELEVSAQEVVSALLDRERLGSTSVGHGFAIPHCKIDGLKQLEASLVRFAEPVDFGAADDTMVRFFFVVLSPPDQPAAHLQVLSQIARILKREDFREQLLTAADAAEVYDAIRRASEAEGL